MTTALTVRSEMDGLADHAVSAAGALMSWLILDYSKDGKISRKFIINELLPASQEAIRVLMENLYPEDEQRAHDDCIECALETYKQFLTKKFQG